ncbi:uncharacterized protein LOC128558918 [Mercenaria mercenaria]|uniref:uncharacterized protein LOC128558918 n=1 Tax=Mercenaria mercenaria TaxID=6596 RepID=UPI00234E9860|nr:uncharacterized protein LOC128558918 [Mercenaria mercenaria]
MTVKKATGYDGIFAKILKLCSPVASQPLSVLITKCTELSTFPENMDVAQVAPIYKKKSTLDKGNYRHVGLLPVTSKIFERAIYTQLLEHFDGIFNPMLGAFRPNYGCNTTLLNISEDWKGALDSNKYLAAVLMDLSKAFDGLPHNLLLLKLQHYNVSEQSVSLIKSYLSNRKQCVKLGSCYSSFRDVVKGVSSLSLTCITMQMTILFHLLVFLQQT